MGNFGLKSRISHTFDFDLYSRWNSQVDNACLMFKRGKVYMSNGNCCATCWFAGSWLLLTWPCTERWTNFI